MLISVFLPLRVVHTATPGPVFFPLLLIALLARLLLLSSLLLRLNRPQYFNSTPIAHLIICMS